MESLVVMEGGTALCEGTPNGQKIETVEKTASCPFRVSPRRAALATIFRAINGESGWRGGRMYWARILAFVTGMVDQELLARNEYLAAENRRLRRKGG